MELSYNQKYYRKNREKIRRYQKGWREKNREKVKKYNQYWYQKNLAKRSEYAKKWWIENKDKQLKLRVLLRKNKKREIFKVLGNKCNNCGISDFRVLQIDHINGGGGKEIRTIGRGDCINHYYKQLILDKPAFLRKYQLLCANCNWIKRYENKEY